VSSLDISLKLKLILTVAFIVILNGYVFYNLGWFGVAFESILSLVMEIGHLVIDIGQYLVRNQRGVVSVLIGGGFWVASISGRLFGKKSMLLTDEEHGSFFISIRMVAFLCIFFPIWYFVPFLIMVPVILGFWIVYSIHVTFSFFGRIDVKNIEGDDVVIALIVFFLIAFMLPFYEVEVYYREKAKRKRGGA